MSIWKNFLKNLWVLLKYKPLAIVNYWSLWQDWNFKSFNKMEKYHLNLKKDSNTSTYCLGALFEMMRNGIRAEAQARADSLIALSRLLFSVLKATEPSLCSITQERKWKWKCWLLSHVWLFVTPWAVARQASQPIRFFRQEYWCGLLFPTSNF